MKQVEEEYYKANEKLGQAPNINSTNQNDSGQNNELFPPSLAQPIDSMKGNEPDEVKDAVNSLIKSQTTIQREENIIVIPANSINEDDLPYDTNEKIYNI
jgi:hypothetical protein